MDETQDKKLEKEKKKQQHQSEKTQQTTAESAIYYPALNGTKDVLPVALTKRSVRSAKSPTYHEKRGKDEDVNHRFGATASAVTSSSC